MKHKVCELEGALLDAAVAKAEGKPFVIENHPTNPPRPMAVWLKGADGNVGEAQFHDGPYQPSSDWALAGPIIERAGITIDRDCHDLGPGQRTFWQAAVAIFGMIGIDYHPPETKPRLYFGRTPLIAAMRTHVAHKLGDEVELP
jgi:hypothetical protein